jgi:hypothetical protein
MTLRSSRTLRGLALASAGAALAHAAPASADPFLGGPPPITADLADPPAYGYKDGLIYLRDRRDLLRLYPHAQLDLDAHGFFGSRVDTLPAADAGVDLGTRFFVRRARLDLGGELLKRIGFNVGIDLAANPAIDGARSDGTQTRVALADAWVNIDAGRGLGLMIGVFQAPFSLENRSATSDLAMMERNVAIRGFVIPGGKALGIVLLGSTQSETLHWDVGAFGAESLDPGHFERHFDAMGRVYTRPFGSHTESLIRGLQIGVSARVGSRHPRDVTGDAPAITTGQGFALWRPTRTDGLGRTLHVIPSGTQASAGVELTVPIGALILRSEGYWVSRSTREAVEGFQSTNSERFGQLQGVGWYAQISAWILQLSGLINSDVPTLGTFPRPHHLELARTSLVPERYGIEIAFLGAGVNARYDGASRAGAPDASERSTKLQVYQLGVAVNYWHTRHFRLSLNGNLYEAPASGSAKNLAVVPGNLGSATTRDADAHALWELGARSTVMF